MPLKYKIDIIAALKEAGYSTYKIRQEKLFSESTLQYFRDNKPVAWENIDRLCDLLKCQPGDILEHAPEEGSES